MSKVKLYTYNILEDGTLTVTGTADSGYPESRLYDREISLYWKDTVTEAKTFHVDQGATVKNVDFLAIAGHNFSGETIAFQYSDNDADWYDAVTSWSQSDNADIVKTLTSALSHRYWRVTVTSMTNPQCAEIFMSAAYEFRVDFNRMPTGQQRSNVRWQETVGGADRSIKYGNRRRIRTYQLALDSTAFSNFETAVDYLDENSKPFYVKDHRNDYYLCRLLGDPEEDYITDSDGFTLASLQLIEQL